MINMIKFSRKILPSFLLAAVIVIAGSFFDGLIASAQNNMADDMLVAQPIHCNAQNQEVQKTSPTGNTLMPCCIERHDNSGTIIPAATQERVKFSQALMTQQVVCATKAIEQKIYPSSPSPPPEAENISCTVKIE